MICLTVFFTGCAAYRDYPPEYLPGRDISIAPYVEVLGNTNATIVWETADKMYGWLQYHGEGDFEIPLVRDTHPGTLHRISLSHLMPGTTYTYSVAGYSGQPHRFRTLHSGTNHFSFAAIGDNRTHPEQFAQVARAVAGHDIDFVLHSGDILSNGRNRDEWYSEWFTPGRAMFARAPVLVAWGNHELPGDPQSWLHQYYRSRSQLHGPGYFSFTHGPAQFISLNIYEPFDPGSAQYRWLAGLLATNRFPFIIVAAHPSPLSGSAHAHDGNVRDTRKYLVPLLARYNVNLMFSGHDHVYDRSRYENTTFVISAGAGAPKYSPKTFLNPFSVFSTACLHYVVCTVTPEKLSCTACLPDGTVLDRFDLNPRVTPDTPAPAGAMFQPPLRDYLEEHALSWETVVCNFSTSWITGTVTVACPASWFVEPGRTQMFFMSSDEATHSLPCRIWPRNTRPGRYQLKISVLLPGTTNTMTCLIEQFSREPAVAHWTFDTLSTSMSCTNRPVSVSQGIWRSDSTRDAVPRLFASIDNPVAASARDVSFYRIRLNGDREETHSRIRWICEDESGIRRSVERTVRLPVDNQWHTCIFPVGREPGWRGIPVEVQIKTVFDPGIMVELDDVRLAAPPLPGISHPRQRY